MTAFAILGIIVVVIIIGAILIMGLRFIVVGLFALIIGAVIVAILFYATKGLFLG